MSKIVEITSAEFEERVLRSPIPVLVDFYSESCGPCRLPTPTLEEIADELNGQMAVYKVDAFVNLDLAQRLNVNLLPTILVVKDGEVTAKLVGLQNQRRILEAIGRET